MTERRRWPRCARVEIAFVRSLEVMQFAPRISTNTLYITYSWTDYTRTCDRRSVVALLRAIFTGERSRNFPRYVTKKHR